MQPMMAGEYAGGPEIAETEPIMGSPDIPPAEVSRPEVGAVGDLSTAVGNWDGTSGGPL